MTTPFFSNESAEASTTDSAQSTGQVVFRKWIPTAIYTFSLKSQPSTTGRGAIGVTRKVRNGQDVFSECFIVAGVNDQDVLNKVNNIISTGQQIAETTFDLEETIIGITTQQIHQVSQACADQLLAEYNFTNLKIYQDGGEEYTPPQQDEATKSCAGTIILIGTLICSILAGCFVLGVV